MPHLVVGGHIYTAPLPYGVLDMYQWIWELCNRLAMENHINELGRGRKRKVPTEELI